MADEAEVLTPKEETPAVDLRQTNKYIFFVIIVDMDDDVRDVLGVLHLCALSQEDAAHRAIFLAKQQGLIKLDGKYYVQAGIMGALPDVPRSKVIVPTMKAPKDL